MRRSFPLALLVTLVVSGCGFATSDPTRSVGHDHATLDGSLFNTKRTGSTSYWFEWGTTTAYGNILAGGSVPADLPNESFNISKKLTGLDPGTAYHWRLCAWDDENVDLKGCSIDRQFNTATTSGPTLTLIERCPVVDGRQVYGVSVTGAGFPRRDPTGSGPFIGHREDLDGVQGGSGFFLASEDGDIDYGGAGRFSPVDLVEVTTWLETDGNLGQNPDEPTLAEGTLERPCAGL